MIVLEGPDQIGKTTAGRKLAKLMGAHLKRPEDQCYRHLSRPALDFDHFESYLAGIGAHVQDRFHLSSLIYGLMLGCGGYPNAHRMLLLQRFMRWRGVLTILMYGEHDWMRANLQPREELYKPEQIILSNTGYMVLTQTTNAGEEFAQVTHNVTKLGYPDDATIEKWFEMWRKSWVG